jgi:hypothetical protein
VFQFSSNCRFASATGRPELSGQVGWVTRWKVTPDAPRRASQPRKAVSAAPPKAITASGRRAAKIADSHRSRSSRMPGPSRKAADPFPYTQNRNALTMT